MEKVGVYFIRYGDLIAVQNKGNSLLIENIKNGETHEQAVLRVLANHTNCKTTGNPIFVITEKTHGENLYIYAVRATDTFGHTLSIDHGIIPQIACRNLREAEKVIKERREGNPHACN